MRLARLLLIASLACAAAACDDEDTAELLAADHPGWTNPACGTCHSLPVEEHTATRPPECGDCHGGNGACDPSGGARLHAATDDCVACHAGGNHGFTATADCGGCHFAAVGVVDCTP